jgi:hypothetical protein
MKSYKNTFEVWGYDMWKSEDIEITSFDTYEKAESWIEKTLSKPQPVYNHLWIRKVYSKEII